MKTEVPKFKAEVIRVDHVPDFPKSWSQDEYRQILHACDFDWPVDFAEEEISDYATIALLDYSPEEAAAIVLKVKLGHVLNNGQIKNLAEEMKSEKTWEEYQDISLHSTLFQCHVLLNQAFPKDFPDTDIARCSLEVIPQNHMGRENLDHADAGFMIRLLADAVGERSILNRFFGKALKSPSFNDAANVVWRYNVKQGPGNVYELKIYGSWYWFISLLEVSDFESEAFCDLQPA